MCHILSYISSFTNTNKNFLQMFNSKHTKLAKTQIEQLAQFLIRYKHCYATTKFDAGKIKVELNQPLEPTAVFIKQQATRTPLQLQERVQRLLDILTPFNNIALVNTYFLTTWNTFINPAIILKKGESI